MRHYAAILTSRITDLARPSVYLLGLHRQDWQRIGPMKIVTVCVCVTFLPHI